MTPVERLRAAEVLLREAHARTSELPVPSELDLAALRSADFGAIFVDPNIALAMAEVLKDAAGEWGDYRGIGTPFTLDRIGSLADALLGGGVA